MLRLSWISVPPGAGISVAWWRDARTSGMTMSLSLARPIVIAPGVDSSPALPGRRIFIIDVAMFDESPPMRPVWDAAGCAVVGGAACTADGAR